MRMAYFYNCLNIRIRKKHTAKSSCRISWTFMRNMLIIVFFSQISGLLWKLSGKLS